MPYNGILEASRMKLWVKARDDVVAMCYSKKKKGIKPFNCFTIEVDLLFRLAECNRHCICNGHLTRIFKSKDSNFQNWQHDNDAEKRGATVSTHRYTGHQPACLCVVAVATAPTANAQSPIGWELVGHSTIVSQSEQSHPTYRYTNHCPPDNIYCNLILNNTTHCEH